MKRHRLSPGHLRHRITIQEFQQVDDGRGGMAESWDTHAQVWARVAPVSAREAFLAGQMQGASTHRVTLRYVDGVTPSMRVAWDGRTFEIQGIRDIDEEHRVLELDVVEERL